jgi:hypothetical protein
MALKRMDNVGIVVEDLEATIDFLASSGLSSKGGPQSKENGPDVSLDWAISASRLP